MFWCFGWEAGRILVSQPDIEPAPPALEGQVLTTGLLGKLLEFWKKNKKTTNQFSVLVTTSYISFLVLHVGLCFQAESAQASHYSPKLLCWPRQLIIELTLCRVEKTLLGVFAWSTTKQLFLQIKKVKRQTTEWEKIFANHNCLISRI